MRPLLCCLVRVQEDGDVVMCILCSGMQKVENEGGTLVAKSHCCKTASSDVLPREAAGAGDVVT